MIELQLSRISIKFDSSDTLVPQSNFWLLSHSRALGWVGEPNIPIINWRNNPLLIGIPEKYNHEVFLRYLIK
jgi:hypothetical protein